jgi:hypothetical protein
LCGEADCDDALDDDGDGGADCADVECSGLEPCASSCVEVELGEVLPVSYDGSFDGAVDRHPGAGCGGPGGPDRSLRWTAPAVGVYTIDSSTSAVDTNLKVLDGHCSGFEIDCADFGMVSVALEAGQTVIVVLEDDDGTGGSYHLDID